METTKNKLTPYEKDFFDKLRNYIDKPIYFYGSIQRDDYLPQASDIDIDIFSNNINSTLFLLKNFLHSYGATESEFKKTIYRMSKNDNVIFGYKGMYIDESKNLKVEIALYDEKDKENVLHEHQRKLDFPFYITFILVFLKTLYYNLGIISTKYYKTFKNFVLDNYYKKKSDFIKL